MNGHIQEIITRLTANYSEQFTSPEDAINELQEVVNRCLDETGEFEARGSHYHYFRQHGITVLLALTKMILFGLDQDYEVFYKELLSKVEGLGYFPENPTEIEILNLLESNINQLFDVFFEELISNCVNKPCTDIDSEITNNEEKLPQSNLQNQLYLLKLGREYSK